MKKKINPGFIFEISVAYFQNNKNTSSHSAEVSTLSRSQKPFWRRLQFPTNKQSSDEQKIKTKKKSGGESVEENLV